VRRELRVNKGDYQQHLYQKELFLGTVNKR